MQELDFEGIDPESTEPWWTNTWLWSYSLQAPVYVRDMGSSCFRAMRTDGELVALSHNDLHIVRPELGWFNTSDSCIYLQYIIGSSYKKGVYFDYIEGHVVNLDLNFIGSSWFRDQSGNSFYRLLSSIFSETKVNSVDGIKGRNGYALSRDFAVVRSNPIIIDKRTFENVLMYRREPIGVVIPDNLEFLVYDQFNLCLDKLSEVVGNAKITIIT